VSTITTEKGQYLKQQWSAPPPAAKILATPMVSATKILCCI